MSTRAQPFEIVTIYSSARAKSTGTRIRLLGILSLIIAASWIDTLDGTIDDTTGVNISITKMLKVEDFKTSNDKWQGVADWLGVLIGLGSLSAATDTVGGNDDIAPLFGGPQPRKKSPEEIEKIKVEHTAAMKKIATLNIGRVVWIWTNRLTGYWLALTGLLTLLTASRGTLKLHTLAGLAIIFSSLLTVVGIWVAIRYGGMPAHATLPLYLKIGGIQSAYGWICIIAAKLLR